MILQLRPSSKKSVTPMRCCLILNAERTTTDSVSTLQLAAVDKVAVSTPASATSLKPSLAEWVGTQVEFDGDHNLVKMPRFELASRFEKHALGWSEPSRSPFLCTVMTVKAQEPGPERHRSDALNVVALVKFDESGKACSVKWSRPRRVCAARQRAKSLPVPVGGAVAMGE
jgi:hypothetical protein